MGLLEHGMSGAKVMLFEMWERGAWSSTCSALMVRRKGASGG